MIFVLFNITEQDDICNKMNIVIGEYIYSLINLNNSFAFRFTFFNKYFSLINIILLCLKSVFY
jgi:hypothetical protein